MRVAKVLSRIPQLTRPATTFTPNLMEKTPVIDVIRPAVQRGHYFEEFEPGRTFRHHWGRTMTEFDAIWFSNLTTQLNPLYFNAEYAKANGHRGIVVHPLWVACTVMGLAVEDLNEIGGPFLGIDNLTIHRETYSGDTIYSETEVLDRRASESRPGWGIVHWSCRGLNQDEELVMSFERRNLSRMRDMAADGISGGAK